MTTTAAEHLIAPLESVLQDYALGLVQDRISRNEPLSGLTQEEVRWHITSDLASLLEDRDAEILRQALIQECSPRFEASPEAFFAAGYVSALVAVSKRVAATFETNQATASQTCPWADSES